VNEFTIRCVLLTSFPFRFERASRVDYAFMSNSSLMRSRVR
jgi:hypothetical protein